MLPPSTIFKYETFTTRTLLNLKAQAVYFSSPLNFNDPYDCAITASISDPTPDELQRVLHHYLDDSDVPPELKTQLSTFSQPELKENLRNGAMLALNENREKFLKKNGVACFSERNDNLLMWSHYGGQYKGLCLEFRTEHEPFNKLFPVKYVERMPQIRIDSILIDNDPSQLIDLFCTKSEAWAYEKEWRGLHTEVGTLFGYRSPALKAVYFGPDIERGALEIVCLILRGQNPDVEFWQGSRSQSEFRVHFEHFTYTPYIDAKQSGLA
jgi:hypothetical protein